MEGIGPLDAREYGTPHSLEGNLIGFQSDKTRYFFYFLCWFTNDYQHIYFLRPTAVDEIFFSSSYLTSHKRMINIKSTVKYVISW